MLQNSKFHEISKSQDDIPRTLMLLFIYYLGIPQLTVQGAKHQQQSALEKDSFLHFKKEARRLQKPTRQSGRTRTPVCRRRRHGSYRQQYIADELVLGMILHGRSPLDYILEAVVGQALPLALLVQSTASKAAEGCSYYDQRPSRREIEEHCQRKTAEDCCYHCLCSPVCNSVRLLLQSTVYVHSYLLCTFKSNEGHNKALVHHIRHLTFGQVQTGLDRIGHDISYSLEQDPSIQFFFWEQTSCLKDQKSLDFGLPGVWPLFLAFALWCNFQLQIQMPKDSMMICCQIITSK